MVFSCDTPVVSQQPEVVPREESTTASTPRTSHHQNTILWEIAGRRFTPTKIFDRGYRRKTPSYTNKIVYSPRASPLQIHRTLATEASLPGSTTSWNLEAASVTAPAAGAMLVCSNADDSIRRGRKRHWTGCGTTRGTSRPWKLTPRRTRYRAWRMSSSG